MTKVLVVGATGVLGSALTTHLLQNNFLVRALVRNKNKAHDLEQAGAEIFVGDITDHHSIAQACQGVDVIVTAAHGMISKGKNSSTNVDEIGHKNLIDCAGKNKLRLLVYTSLHGARPDHPIDFFRTKHTIEQYLTRSGLPFAILSLPAFMEWHVHNLLGKSIQEKGRTVILGSGNNPTNFLAVQDLVRAIKIIIENESFHNNVIQIAGPENISRNDVAKLYGKALQITPRITHIPVSAIKFLSRVISPFHPGIARVLKLSAYGDSSDFSMNTSHSIQQFGLTPTTVEAFIREKVNGRT